MAKYFYGTPRSLGSELMNDLFRYRYQVFVFERSPDIKGIKTPDKLCYYVNMRI